MTQRIDSSGQVWVKVPVGATHVAGDGTFYTSRTYTKGVHGCPELTPTEHVEWSYWDVYHGGWAVCTNHHPKKVLVLKD